MRNALSYMPVIAVLAFCQLGCSTTPRTAAGRADLRDEAQVTMRKFERQDPSLTRALEQSAGYAVFPSVGKGGVVVGGAYGKGVLYVNGTMAGYCDLTQASIGFQAGGQDYSELLVFKERRALESFQRGEYALTAEVSAVAIKPGAAASAEFRSGVAVFTATNAGLMYEAAVAGQKFKTVPSDSSREHY